MYGINHFKNINISDDANDKVDYEQQVRWRWLTPPKDDVPNRDNNANSVVNYYIYCTSHNQCSGYESVAYITWPKRNDMIDR